MLDDSIAVCLERRFRSDQANWLIL
jgi:hypothetical protein